MLIFGEASRAATLLMVAAAALIDDRGRVLVQQRPEHGAMAGLWEFPGGKIEPNETPEVALARELHEELGITISSALPLNFASAPLDDCHLVMLLFACRDWQGEPRLLHANALRWVEPTDLHSLQMPPADEPLIASVIFTAQRGRE